MPRTVLTERLGIALPIVQAGLGPAGRPPLAASVSAAGALGMLSGLGALSPASIRREIREVRARTDRPFGVNLLLNAPPDALQPRLAACLEEGVSAVSFFWGDPAPHVEACHRAGAVVLACVGSVGEARLAAAAGVDVVAAQGWEAGGHVRGEVSTLALVPRVVDAVAPLPVLAAGGIADGRGLAAALTLGAAGAYVGTALLLAEEASVHPHYRARLLAATEADTAHTRLFDGGFGSAPHRVLRNSTLAAWEAAGRPPPGQRPGEGQVVATSPRGPIPRYRATVASLDVEGDVEAMPLWAGQGVGLATRVRPAAEILADMASCAEATLRRLGGGARPPADIPL
ncbi:NAD(P)H-dependent flavin oxidoreductase [Sabulicella glaciei]|uniref:Nitronate monooxygenase n=1 Tax=Sabulicella glaciei TaxID=2984948 RepID=A0ABT3P0H7_9PROT|nr:nitronate monooxygenase [Roseococcus sp. MDT2-1-1]MCW8087922.1 nitronate monooxygenase [Roseococcus sp. MDT2-1-1]